MSNLKKESTNAVILSASGLAKTYGKGSTAVDVLKEIDLEVSSEAFSTGARVRVTAGPMIGLIGELVELKSAHRFVIKLGELGQSIMVNMPPAYIEKW